jgi:RNA polymerase sigma factor (sigma-70 family)
LILQGYRSEIKGRIPKEGDSQIPNYASDAWSLLRDMKIEERAIAMASRVARRLTKDSGIASAEDFVSVGAMAIIATQGEDEAIQWAACKNAIIDEHRRVFGRKDGTKREGGRNTEYLETKYLDPFQLTDLSDDEQIKMAVELRKVVADLPLTLTPSQVSIVHLIARGWTVQRIAHELKISPETVRTHTKKARSRIKAKNAAHLVAKAIKYGYIDLEKL